MRTLRWTIPAFLAALLLVPACVQLTGQRITWFYDANLDTLHFLIHYDGIHDKEDSKPPGAEQLPEFVNDGDVMLFDWPFHLQRDDLARNAGSRDPMDRDTAQLLMSLQTRNLGHYREPDGRIGAAQLVSIPKATEWVAQLNDLISRALLAAGSPSPGFTRSMERIRAAAAMGHSWIELRGHSIRGSLPVHPGEWSLVKASAIAELFDDALKDHLREPGANSAPSARILTRMLSSAPLSYIDEGDRITFVLGRPDQPTTLRALVRDTYEPNLEEIVTAAVPQDLDQVLARALLDEDHELPEQLAPLLAWGPGENQLRALLAAWSGLNGAERRAAAERIARWGARWNREQGVPEAPLGVDPDEFFDRWASWYGRVVNLGR